MVTTFLVTHRWVSITVFGVIVLLGLLAGRWLAGRRRLSWTLFGLTLLPVVLLTLAPSSREVFERCAVGWALPSPGRVEVLANVSLLIPPVLLAAVASRRLAIVLVAAVVGSAAIEVLQALAPGLGRSCDTNDWLANSIGAVIGVVLAWAAMAGSRRQAPELEPAVD